MIYPSESLAAVLIRIQSIQITHGVLSRKLKVSRWQPHHSNVTERQRTSAPHDKQQKHLTARHAAAMRLHQHEPIENIPQILMRIAFYQRFLTCKKYVIMNLFYSICNGPTGTNGTVCGILTEGLLQSFNI